MMGRTIVIGDIHGALKALEQVLLKADVQPTDKLIFLGDYVDGWSESAQVIEYLVELDKRQECIFIKGNHDAWCEQWLATGIADKTWTFHGGASTMVSYERLSAGQRDEHLAFFKRMHNYYVDEDNRLYIHAGFTSMHGPDHEQDTNNYNMDRTLWEMARTMDDRIEKNSKLYPKRLLLFKEIFIGHTPTLYYDVEEPMQACNVWNVDTGAAFYGRLSAMDANSKEFWQSDKPLDMYPGEKGRNK